MSKNREENRKGIQDPVVEAGIAITLLFLILMIGYANPFNPLPFMVSIVGLITGLYLIALRVAPKEAKEWRESLLQKLDSLFNWSKKSVQTTIEKRKEKSEKAEEELPKGEFKFCIYCGEKISKNAVFCSKCGKKQE